MKSDEGLAGSCWPVCLFSRWWVTSRHLTLSSLRYRLCVCLIYLHFFSQFFIHFRLRSIISLFLVILIVCPEPWWIGSSRTACPDSFRVSVRLGFVSLCSMSERVVNECNCTSDFFSSLFFSFLFPSFFGRTFRVRVCPVTHK